MPYSIDYSEATPSQSEGVASSSEPQDARHLVTYQRPRRWLLPSVLKTVLTVSVTGLAFFAIEAYAPREFTISKLMGTNDARITEEVKAAELRVQARYEAWAAQTKVSVEQQNDRYRVQNQAVLAEFQASLDLTKMSQEAALRVQAALVDQQMALTRSQQSTDVSVVNFARLLGRGANLLEPGSGGAALSYSDRLAGELTDELTAAARRGQLVSFEGWGSTLPSAADLQRQFDAIPPLAIPPTPAMEMESGELGSIDRSR